jgi:5-oxoprolinase (ATP-hydrolysing) subunit A
MPYLFSVDLNCDMGESFGAYTLGNDNEILNWVSSANIACGYHAGDPLTMQHTVKAAMQKGVAIGAHPGLQDLAGFGRRQMAISPTEAYTMVLYQVGALWAFVKAEGGELHHVKPHGALYNMAAMQKELAAAIAEAVYKINPNLILYGLAGSALIQAAQALSLPTAQEVFADRTYQDDGTLTPRSQPNALITDPAEAAQQVLRMVKQGTVKSQQGNDISIQADTICIHGDGPHALLFAEHIHTLLKRENIEIKAQATQKA